MTIMTRLRRLFGAPDPRDPFADLDPLPRRAPAEPVFPLMGRDQYLAPGWTRLYAAALDRKDRAQIHAILDATLDRFLATPPRPTDKRKAWSARHKADQMELWHVEHMRAEQPRNRPAPPPDDGWRPIPTANEIRSARPPQEPEEAS